MYIYVCKHIYIYMYTYMYMHTHIYPFICIYHIFTCIYHIYYIYRANQKLLEAMLKQRGHEVRCTENGLEAVNLSSTVEFDLVLMDCNMPVLNGFDATLRIRARKGLNEKVSLSPSRSPSLSFFLSPPLSLTHTQCLSRSLSLSLSLSPPPLFNKKVASALSISLHFLSRLHCLSIPHTLAV